METKCKWESSQVMEGKTRFLHGCLLLVFAEIPTTLTSSHGKHLNLQSPGPTLSLVPMERTTRSSAPCSPIDGASKGPTARSGPSTSGPSRHWQVGGLEQAGQAEGGQGVDPHTYCTRHSHCVTGMSSTQISPIRRSQSGRLLFARDLLFGWGQEGKVREREHGEGGRKGWGQLSRERRQDLEPHPRWPWRAG